MPSRNPLPDQLLDLSLWAEEHGVTPADVVSIHDDGGRLGVLVREPAGARLGLAVTTSTEGYVHRAGMVAGQRVKSVGKA